MSRNLTLCLLFALIPTVCCRARQDNAATHELKKDTHTIYQNRVFETTSRFTADAPVQTVNRVMEKFIRDLDTDPYSLFDNLLKGMGDEPAENSSDKAQSEKTPRFSVEIKSCVFDTAHNYYIGVLDIYMGSRIIEDVKLYGRIVKKYNGKNGTFIFELLNNPIAKKAVCHITTEQTSGDQTVVEMKTDFQFMWLLNIFFSMKNYKNVAEWRLDKFMQNFDEEILKLRKTEIYANEQ